MKLSDIPIRQNQKDAIKKFCYERDIDYLVTYFDKNPPVDTIFVSLNCMSSVDVQNFIEAYMSGMFDISELTLEQRVENLEKKLGI